MAKNSVILSDLRNYENNNQNRTNNDNKNEGNNNYDFFNQSESMLYHIIKQISTPSMHAAGNGREMTRMINTHIEASKIGRQIAEQVLDYQRRMGDHSSESSPDPDPTLAQTVSLVSEGQLHASIINMENSSTSPEAPTRLNGTYTNFTNYNQQPARSNLENGKINFKTLLH